VAAVFVVAVAVIADPWGLAPFGPSKWAVASIGVLALAAAIARRRRLAVVRLPTLLLLALVLWTAVTAVFGVDPLYAWIGTPERHWGVVAWALFLLAFVSGQAMRPVDGRTVTAGVAVSVGLVGTWAVAEVLGWQPFDVVGGSSRPGGPFGSSAYLGSFAALALPIAVAVALDRSYRPVARSAAATATVLGTAALVGSGARAAWGGALVAFLVWAGARPRRPTGRRHLLGVVSVAAVLVAAAVATGVADRVPALATDERGGVRGRIDEWRVASAVVADHPLLGVGPEGYRIAFPDAVDEEYEQAHGRSPLPDRAHSAVLDVAATTGVPGAVAYLALLGIVGAFALRGIRGRDRRITAAAVGVVGYFAQSLVLFPVPELDVVAWLLAGLVVGATVRSGEKRSYSVSRVVPVALGVVGFAALMAGVLDVAADRSARRALADAADADRAMHLRPDALRYRLVAARAHEATGTADGLDAAIERLREARALSPGDPVAGTELGRLLLDRARRTGAAVDIDQARRHLEGLAPRDPHNAETQLRLGLARALDGDDAAAEQAWLSAERLAPRSAAASTNLALAYARLGRTDDARAAAGRALRRDPAAERAHDVLRMIDGT
jgi:O-antigen ligase/Flp pilus assembly protein TadD